MNKHLCTLLIALAATGPLAAFAGEAVENDPAYLAIEKSIDLKIIQPEVNINLPSFLLQGVVSGLSSGTNDPLAGTGTNFADLLKDVKLIRVVVIEAKKDDRAALEKGVKTLRAELNAKWTPVVAVQDEGDNVGIYAMGDPKGEAMAGLAGLIHDGGDGDTVIVNIVGNVSIGKLLQAAQHMNGMPKNLMQKLGGLGNLPVAKSGASHADAAAPKPAATPAGETNGAKKDN